jgi:hypothetical protein
MKKENQEIYSILNNIHFETKLLESLDWDDDALSRLLKFVFQALEENYSQEFIFDKIKENFSESACIIIKELFVTTTFELKVKDSKYEN